MNQERAERILAKMAKERYRPTSEVLDEYRKYADARGEVQHFWPDENTACKFFIDKEPA